MTTSSSDGIDDAKRLELQHRTDKARSKSNFMCTRNSMLLLFDESDKPNRKEIRHLCKKLNLCMDLVMEVMAKCSEFYLKIGELQKGTTIVDEMETIEKVFYTSYDAAQTYLDSSEDVSAGASGTELHILDNSEVNSIQKESCPLPYANVHRDQAMSNGTGCIEADVHGNRSNKNTVADMCYERQATLDNRNESEMQTKYPDDDAFNRVGKSNHFAQNVHSKLRESATISSDSPSIGQDLWQLKRIEIPVFSGDKRMYQSWKAAFVACIDNAPATGEYKLLRLRQYLSGDALKAIENLGHSTAAYSAAKERLERKYGGRRRQIAINLEELENFRPIQVGNARDLEDFADLLEIATINLEESGQQHQLEDGSLYIKLQRKLPESMLAMYHRWLFEHNNSGSVLSLRKWVIEESQFKTVASETVNGITCRLNNISPAQSISTYESPRTFFTGQSVHENIQRNKECPVCEGHHNVWDCLHFIEKSIPNRWKTAKRLQLCYRCLSEGHYGKSCHRSHECRQNDCRELHHQLLHRQHKPQSRERETRFDASMGNRNNNNNPTAQRCLFSQDINSGTEGKNYVRKSKRCSMEGKGRCTEQKDRYTEWKDRCTERKDRYTEGKDRYTEGKDRCTERKDRYTERKDRYAEGKERYMKEKDGCAEKKRCMEKERCTERPNTDADIRQAPVAPPPPPPPLIILTFTHN